MYRLLLSTKSGTFQDAGVTVVNYVWEQRGFLRCILSDDSTLIVNANHFNGVQIKPSR